MNKLNVQIFIGIQDLSMMMSVLHEKTWERVLDTLL